MSITFLFWNLRGNQQGTVAARQDALLGALAGLASVHRPDVFVFAECAMVPAELTVALDRAGTGVYTRVPGQSRRIRFYSRLPVQRWSERYFEPVPDRLSIQQLRIPGSPGLLIAGTHFPDPRNTSIHQRTALARDVASEIRAQERRARHSRTVLVGDFNMNPFDLGLVEASGLHGLLSRRLASTISGLQARRRYPCFYNPMWSCLGDRPGDRPPGTYFHDDTSDPANHFWQLYDQVLLRPDLMHALSRLDILTSAGPDSLITDQGRPRGTSFSDHLPVLFVLDV